MAQLVKPTKNVKRSVADPSSSYHSLKPLWKRSRAVLQGQDNVKAHDEYLTSDYKPTDTFFTYNESSSVRFL